MQKFLFFLLLLLACSNNKENATTNSTDSSKTVTTIMKGSVASAHPLATQAGLDILNKGGNAFDAAIAVAATLNVVEPMMSGIGGYGTTLVYDAKSKQVRFLNSSGRFPINTDTDLMRAPTTNYQQNRVGPKSISTPGNLNAWAAMHKEYGQLPWSNLFTAAIQHADAGYAISPLIAGMIERAFKDFSSYSRAFYGKNDEPLKAGATLIQKDLANTFQQIAKEGGDSFYHGAIAKAIDKKMKEVGSFLALEDLQQNKAEWWTPLKMDYRGYSVYTASLPANAFPAFVNLGLMKQFPQGELAHNSPEYLHYFAEMTKESYKSRLAYSFDPDIQVSPLDSIFSTDFLQAQLAAIDPNKASIFEPPFSKESKNTTHFVVMDQWGNIVSATQTLGNVFGSRVMVEGTGIWLNNSMAYATYEPKGNPMDAFPGRHKLSGDCPVIILKDGLPWAALGSPGGHTITQNVPQIIINLIDYQMSMQAAIDAPKIAFVEPNHIRVDQHLSGELVKTMERKGHTVKKGNIGNAHGIKILRNEKGVITGFEEGIDQRSKQKKPTMDH